jgi:hypothetical protein
LNARQHAQLPTVTLGFLLLLSSPLPQVEEEFEIDLNDNEPDFLRGQTQKTGVEMSPIKIVKNPDGSMQRAAMTQVRGLGLGAEGAAVSGLWLVSRGVWVAAPAWLGPSLPPKQPRRVPDSAACQPAPPPTAACLPACLPACLQSALAKERRELREQQNRMLIEAIPKDLSKPWEDPLAGGQRRLAAGTSAAGVPDAGAAATGCARCSTRP